MDNPTNRELKIVIENNRAVAEERHNDLLDILADIQKDMKEVKEQTTKTNGRVSKLEWWKAAVIWLIGALYAGGLVFFPYLMRNYQRDAQIMMNESIKTQTPDIIRSVLSEYEDVEIKHE